MVSNSPEYIIEEVSRRYGIEVPLEIVITYLETDPDLTPESLYDYYVRYTPQPVAAISLNGYKVADWDEANLPQQPGVYLWLLKDGVELPAIEGYWPQYTCVEVDGRPYRVLYVGQAKRESLYDRVFQMHLKGNPRHSTLCWSLAAIKGMPYSLDEQRKPNLDKDYCQDLRSWLRDNCILIYKVCKNKADIDEEESRQIQAFTPPLNLAHNPLKQTDPYIQRVSKYRHVSGGYKDASASRWDITKIIPFVLIAGGALTLLYFALQ